MSAAEEQTSVEYLDNEKISLMEFSLVEINDSLEVPTDGAFLSLTSTPSYLAYFLDKQLDNGWFSDTSADSRSDMSASLRSARYLVQNVELYFIPIVALVGLLTNTLNFVVFMATHLKRHSCNIYLASLAIANNVFLICVLISWCEKIHVNTSQFCGVLVYLIYVSSFLSIWYVVTFSIELYISVCFPLSRDKFCNTKVAKMVVLGLAGVALLAYGSLLFTSGSVTVDGVSVCGPLPQYIRIVSAINGIDTFLTLALPTILVMGCNVRIAYVVWSFYRMHRCQLGGSSQPVQRWYFGYRDANRIKYKEAPVDGLRPICYGRVGRETGSEKPTPAFIKQTLHMRATRMLLVVSTVFLLCNMPNKIARLYVFLSLLANSSFVPKPSFIACQGFSQMLYYLNFTVNFFIYALSGRSFRLGLSRLLTKIRKKRGDEKCYSLYKKPIHG